jgi:tetratricopeptide (TPR) repeat protein
MSVSRGQLLRRLTGPLLGLGTLAVYAATLSHGASPGVSARFITENAGLFYRTTASSFLWTVAVRLLAAIPVGGLADKVNLFSALCGAASVWLLYTLMSDAVRRTAELDDPDRAGAGVAAWAAGVSAAVSLAFCVPFWTVSNRAHLASFDTLLLLLALRLFQGYAAGGPARLIWAFALLYGAVATEFATAIVAAPLVGIGLLVALWRRDALTGLRVAGLALAALAVSLSLYALAAWAFYGSPGYVARTYEGFFQAVWFVWRQQYLMITRSLPRVGWLTVLLVSVVPWLTALLVARRGLNDERDWTYYVLHALMTAVAAAVILNHRMAPWPMLAERRLLVTPYVLTASLIGYLAAYWFLVPGTWWPEPEGGFRAAARRALPWISLAAFLALPCVAAVRNAGQADARPCGFIARYAEAVLDRLDGRTWLVTDGVLDDVLLVGAADRGTPLRIVNTAGANSEIYMNYVSGLMESPALKNAARLGMVALLREWFQSDTNVAARVAVLWPSDVWMAGGCAAVPRGVVFLGAADPARTDTAALLAEHQRLWADLEPALKDGLRGGERAAAYATFLLTRLSLGANNLGVFCEDLGRTNEAYTAYSKAREINPENVSALLNLHTLVRRGYAAADRKAIQADVQTLMRGAKGKYRIWSLSRHDGYVRMPEAYAQLGMMWAYSGQPGMALSGLKRAVELAPRESRSRMARALADVYLDQNREQESETLYRQLLGKDPKDVGALLGMARVAMRRNDFAEAGDFLQKAEAAGAERTRVTLAWAALHLASGRADKARIALEELVDLQPNLPAGWSLLADVLLAQGETETLDKAIERMRDVPGTELVRAFSLARLAAGRGDPAGARKHAEDALRLAPRDLRILEFILALDSSQQKWDAAEKHAKALLDIAPQNAVANYVLGSIHLMKGQYAMAEDLLRRSLAVRETPDALNNLAWLLQERGETAEAEKTARRAVELGPKSPANWDTLGVVLTRAGRLDEAADALSRALDLGGVETLCLLHMCEVQVRKGQLDRAAENLAGLRQKQRELPVREQEKLAELDRELDRLRRRATAPDS